MTQIAPISPLAMPQALAEQIGQIVAGGSYFAGTEPGDPGFRMPPAPPRFHPAAPAVLVQHVRMSERASAAHVTDWVNKLAAGVNQAPSEDDMPLRITAIRMACADLPVGVWNKETLAEALRTFEWWPSAAKVYGLLKPHADRLASTLAALRRIVDAQPALPAPAPREAPTPEAVEHVSAVVQAFTEERTWNRPETAEMPPARPQARVLTQAELLVTYEAAGKAGSPAASLRAAQIRKRLARKAPRVPVPEEVE